jgi:DNA-binding transcriptional regulator YdaS (Cro superfamily)
MKLKNWLEQEGGRAAAMARHFDVTDAAINDWKTNGVPVRRMKAVAQYTDGAVTLEEMVPDSSAQQAEAHP